jgi:hypothetical protein
MLFKIVFLKHRFCFFSQSIQEYFFLHEKLHVCKTCINVCFQKILKNYIFYICYCTVIREHVSSRADSRRPENMCLEVKFLVFTQLPSHLLTFFMLYISEISDFVSVSVARISAMHFTHTWLFIFWSPSLALALIKGGVMASYFTNFVRSHNQRNHRDHLGAKETKWRR